MSQHCQLFWHSNSNTQHYYINILTTTFTCQYVLLRFLLVSSYIVVSLLFLNGSPRVVLLSIIEVQLYHITSSRSPLNALMYAIFKASIKADHRLYVNTVFKFPKMDKNAVYLSFLLMYKTVSIIITIVLCIAVTMPK